MKRLKFSWERKPDCYWIGLEKSSIGLVRSYHFSVFGFGFVIERSIPGRGGVLRDLGIKAEPFSVRFFDKTKEFKLIKEDVWTTLTDEYNYMVQHGKIVLNGKIYWVVEASEWDMVGMELVLNVVVIPEVPDEEVKKVRRGIRVHTDWDGLYGNTKEISEEDDVIVSRWGGWLPD